jgi:hypothetical protein
VTTGASWERLDDGVATRRRCRWDRELPPVPEGWGCHLVYQLRQERLLRWLYHQMVCCVEASAVIKLSVILIELKGWAVVWGTETGTSVLSGDS